ncbi:RNA deprotection pyrophosphohydrolase [Niallia sp. 01092]|uniref:RNA deprotection pyrophosphohydrolase n=1 Tax=unclassified Niallia TaxID=2837522 RepID=UPI003FD55434
MDTFYDFYGSKVTFSFQKEEFPTKAEHVIVICYMRGKWLLTQHKKRGLEFPGGKVECGECIEDAAKREVYEETGAIIQNMHWIAQYQVHLKNNYFVKAVYFAVVDKLMKKEDYLETNGPILIEDSDLEQRWNDQFSFIMKDNVMKLCLSKIKEEFYLL